MESDDLIGLIKGDLLNDVFKDDNHNEQSLGNEKQIFKGASQLENEPSVLVMKEP